MLWSPPFHRWENWGMKRSCNLLRIVQFNERFSPSSTIADWSRGGDTLLSQANPATPSGKCKLTWRFTSRGGWWGELPWNSQKDLEPWQLRFLQCPSSAVSKPWQLSSVSFLVSFWKPFPFCFSSSHSQILYLQPVILMSIYISVELEIWRISLDIYFWKRLLEWLCPRLRNTARNDWEIVPRAYLEILNCNMTSLHKWSPANYLQWKYIGLINALHHV